ncbi:CACTA en-spm transposon protein [Cucumis melo var. makuwa]|uniref:CACTA en-spm transposon protein n=1 Tax=Cucumis melo var. makuwa TaxID=1194695 RepID=A0A5D3BQX2_CUCMM|nr:CACTA en-spm transposon protein [Cucumis melo var. makuwa]TYK00666.1 CACTA en-spm transposon protein [Cucumis melo var. makuwa]
MRIWDVPKVDNVKNGHLNVLKIVVSHRVNEHIKDNTLCKTNIDPAIIERLVVRHVIDDFIDDVDEHLSHASGTSNNDELYTMSSFLYTNFLETDAMFLEFSDDLDNLVGGSSLMGDNSGDRRVCRKKFSVRCLKWAGIGREYIEVVKDDLQLDFNDQAMNRHLKKYSDPEEARANPPHLLVGRDED